jgi:hypothetical protein
LKTQEEIGRLEEFRRLRKTWEKFESHGKNLKNLGRIRNTREGIEKFRRNLKDLERN